MKKNSMRYALGIVAASLMLTSLGAGCMAGGDGSADLSNTAVASDAQVTVVTITAKTISQLQPGEKLLVDSRDTTKVFKFDTSEGAIDFSQIDLICPNGQKMEMDLWLLKQQEEQGVDIQLMIKGGFAIGGAMETSKAYATQMEKREAGGGSGYQPQMADTICFCDVYSCSDGLIIIICDCYEF